MLALSVLRLLFSHPFIQFWNELYNIAVKSCNSKFKGFEYPSFFVHILLSAILDIWKQQTLCHCCQVEHADVRKIAPISTSISRATNAIIQTNKIATYCPSKQVVCIIYKTTIYIHSMEIILKLLLVLNSMHLVRVVYVIWPIPVTVTYSWAFLYPLVSWFYSIIWRIFHPLVHI